MTSSPETPDIPRFVPDASFPPYSYIPGRFPHPENDPAGHSFGLERPTLPPLDPSDWPNCRPYLRGVDLFNRQYYWESHVEWESVWLACGRRGTVADFVKGLIKLAAAGVKHLEGVPRGVESHAGRAAELWRTVVDAADAEEFLGIHLGDLIALAETIRREGWPAEPPLLLPRLPEK